jgi:hypothetical protein
MEQSRVRGRFAPGVSGNPAGRPRRGISFAERVRELVDTDKIIEFLDEVVRDPGHKVEVRVAAATHLLDRAYGKPDQAVNVEARVAAGAVPALPEAWDEMTREQRAAWLAANLPAALPGAK